MQHLDRVLIGVLFILVGVVVLWYGSPERLGLGGGDPMYSYGFVLLFALGFIIASMGLMGATDAYPALLSGFVLYFIIGALMAVFLYVSGDGVGRWTLEDASDSGFWAYWMKAAALWPLRLVGMLGILGYEPI